MHRNLLADSTSPYLLQHKDNPVAWRPWGEEAFAEAGRLGKPVFLSIGYSTCHWCHVMAHESFENPEIAALMNESFVNIKVDREERPDVDRLYMAFVQATTGQGGWPMSVWLTPEGKPFFGGTYFPPEDRYGRIGFPGLCRQIARLWAEDRARVEAEGTRVLAALAEAVTANTPTTFAGDREPIRHAVEAFLRAFDPVEGGFGNAPKFPRTSVYDFLQRCGGERGREAVLFTLRKMAAGGLRDHLGGGFHRYSVDEFWHVPHFEKMLYDQAQLAVSYLEAWQITGDDFYAGIVRQTLDYVLRDMTHPEGGFFSAEDADSLPHAGAAEHAEGAFYVWTQREIVEELGAEAAEIFCRHYGVRENGNVPPGSDPHGEFFHKNILIERESGEHPSLAESRARLFARRSKRPRPHLDDKILTAWNGLMISAFARAGAALAEPRYLDAARRAAKFLQKNLTVQGDLLRSWREGPGTIRGFAEDYAFLIQALLDLFEADLDDTWLEWALDLQRRQDGQFWDAPVGNYFSSPPDDPLVALRMKEDYDGAEPSANSVSARNLLRLARVLNDGRLEDKARGIIAAAAATLERIPTAVPQMLLALDLALAPPEQAVLAGAADDPAVRRALGRLHAEFAPHRLILRAGGLAARSHPELAEMKPVNGRPALYVCRNFACQAPEVLE
jgi:Highly conserved protein containing a thioredoxin domain